ncbi:hypothetical protein [Azospirillum canadense]|uniref:hypothetical protein n=1 Tax=Azospirillum canadense TaxID=403962 RepID=UPI002226ECF1|nr:hypothetical protein [Azospirillum canadense]MCW2235778.1 hypothetical protein [Azospirillum canadense]
MPNLQDIIDNPEALQASVQRMMNYRGSRCEVSLNHGIRTTEELDQLVRSAPADVVDIKAYQRILGIDAE